MSFVTVTMTKEFIIITSDGQITSTDNLEVIEDKYVKFGKLNPHLCLVATGDVVLAEMVYQKCEKLVKSKALYSNIKELAIEVERLLEEYKDSAECNIGLTGFDNNNLAELSIISSNKTYICTYTLTKEDAIFVPFCSPYTDREAVLKSYNEKVQGVDFRFKDELVNILHKIHSEVENVDPSVNSEFYVSIFDRKYNLIESIRNFIEKITNN